MELFVYLYMTKRLSGIYIITNIKNGKQYVGSSVNIKYRFTRHKQMLRDNMHKNPKLQASYNKYGKDLFFYTIVELVEQLENLLNREQYYMDKLNPWFNVCKIAGNVAGLKHTKETIEKCIAANKRRKGSHHHGRNGKVVKMTLSGEEIETYRSCREAAEYVTNSKGAIKTIGGKIAESIKRNATAYGYTWKFIDKY